MNKIESMTPEQEQQLIAFRDEWLKIGLSTDEADRQTAECAITDMYRRIDKESPIFWWCDSPMSANLIINILQNADYKKLGSNLENQLGGQLRGQLGGQLGDQLGGRLRDQLGGRLRDQLGGQLWGRLRDQLGGQLWGQLGDQLRDQLRGQLGDQLRDQLRGQIGDQLRGQLWGQLGDQLRDQLWGQLGDQLRDQLWGQLGDQLGGQLRDQLRDQLGGQLWGQLRDQLRDQLWDQLEDQLRGNFKYQPTNLWGALDSYWIAYYLFPHEHLRQMYTAEQMQLLNLWADIAKSTFWWYPFDGVCFISNRPAEIHKDEEGRLHNADGPALSFRDTYAVYTLWGVNIDHEMLNYDPAQIMAVKNAEQRMVLIKRYGLENMLNHFETKTLDARDDYELLLITIEGRQCEFLKMINPTTAEVHVEGVAPGIKTVNDALAWRMNLDVFTNPKFAA